MGNTTDLSKNLKGELRKAMEEAKIQGILPEDIIFEEGFASEDDKDVSKSVGSLDDMFFIRSEKSLRRLTVWSYKEGADEPVIFSLIFAIEHEKQEEDTNHLTFHGADTSRITASFEQVFSEEFLQKATLWINEGAIHAEYFLSLEHTRAEVAEN